jgi:uncharacterized membrane protein YfhO
MIKRVNTEEKQTWLFNEKGNFLVMEKEKERKKHKNNPFKWLFVQNPVYIAAFFLPAVILFVSYMLFQVFPRGTMSVLSLDLNGQYVYYFDYMHDVLRGTESLFYSWSKSLSGEFLGIFGYYLASPFNFIVWAFPREYITEGLLTMLVVKVGAIGVTAAVYLKRGRSLSSGTALIFSMMYALSSYTIVQTMNPMWLDGVLALPLVAYGIESLIKYGRFRMLILSLFYSFVTCFYIGFMIALFATVYFILQFISSRATQKFDSGEIAARVGIFAISGAVAALMSSFMLIPVYNSLRLGKLDFTVPDWSMRPNFVLFDIGQKLLPNSYDTVRWDGLPFIYAGMLMVILVPLYFLSGNGQVVTVKRRVTSGLLLLMLTLCMYIAPFDMAMHGGQVPNWLPYRYSFMLSFLLVIWAAEVYDKLSEYPRKAIAISAVFFLAFAVYLESRDTFAPHLGDNGRELLDSMTVILPAIIGITILTIFLIIMKSAKRNRGILSAIIGLIVISELFFSTYHQIQKQHTDIVYSARNTYNDFILPLREKVDEIRENDPEFYRMEKDFFRTVNDPLALRMYGFSHSASMLNERAINFIGQLGMTSRGHYTRYSGATPIINDLFGIRYVLSLDRYGYGQSVTKESIIVRHNENALPIAYLTDPMLTRLNFAYYENDNVFTRQNRMLSAMLGESFINAINVTNGNTLHKETENVTENMAGNNIAYKAVNSQVVATGNAKVRYSLTAETDGEIYMWLPSLYERRLNVWVNRKLTVDSGELTVDSGELIVDSALHPESLPVDNEMVIVTPRQTLNEFVGNYFEFDDYHILRLGEFKAGEEFFVTLTLTRDDLYYEDAFFAYIDNDVYLPAIRKLNDVNADTRVTKNSPTDITINVTAGSEKLLFTTIPAEPGWTMTVNGVQQDYIEVMDTFIGIILPAGTHTVNLKFTPAGYPLALILTGAGFVIFVILSILYLNLKKEREKLDTEIDDSDNDDEDYLEETFVPEEEAEAAVEEGLAFEPEPEIEIESEPEAEPEIEIEIESEPEIEPEPEFEFDTEPETEEDEEEEAGEVILGNDDAFQSVVNDFYEINNEPEPEPEYVHAPEPEQEPDPEINLEPLVTPDIELEAVEPKPAVIDFEARRRALEAEFAEQKEEVAPPEEQPEAHQDLFAFVEEDDDELDNLLIMPLSEENHFDNNNFEEDDNNDDDFTPPHHRGSL